VVACSDTGCFATSRRRFAAEEREQNARRADIHDKREAGMLRGMRMGKSTVSKRADRRNHQVAFEATNP
jgi:hypothetical protein